MVLAIVIVVDSLHRLKCGEIGLFSARFRRPITVVFSLTAGFRPSILSGGENQVPSRVVARLLLFCSMRIKKTGTFNKVRFPMEDAWI
jgi:hypothetical protein